MNLWIAQRCPPGSNAAQDWIFTMILGMFFAGGLVTHFIGNYRFHYAHLFVQVMGKPVLNPEAVMPDFALLHYPVLPVLLLYALFSLIQAAQYYSSYYIGSKSIYLMRRLPDPWERWRRCLTLPALYFLSFLLLLGILLLLTFVFYHQFTPEACLTPMQGQKFWAYTFTGWFDVLRGYGHA